MRAGVVTADARSTLQLAGICSGFHATKWGSVHRADGRAANGDIDTQRVRHEVVWRGDDQIAPAWARVTGGGVDGVGRHVRGRDVAWAEGKSMCCGGGSPWNVDQHTTGRSHQVRPGISDERARMCRRVREGHHDVTLSVRRLQWSVGDREVIVGARAGRLGRRRTRRRGSARWGSRGDRHRRGSRRGGCSGRGGVLGGASRDQNDRRQRQQHQFLHAQSLRSPTWRILGEIHAQSPAGPGSFRDCHQMFDRIRTDIRRAG